MCVQWIESPFHVQKIKNKNKNLQCLWRASPSMHETCYLGVRNGNHGDFGQLRHHGGRAGGMSKGGQGGQ